MGPKALSETNACLLNVFCFNPYDVFLNIEADTLNEPVIARNMFGKVFQSHNRNHGNVRKANNMPRHPKV